MEQKFTKEVTKEVLNIVLKRVFENTITLFEKEYNQEPDSIQLYKDINDEVYVNASAGDEYGIVINNLELTVDDLNF